jgi:hypothetical protein
MSAWRALAGAATVGQGRKPRSGVASRDSLDGLAVVRPLRGKRSCSYLGKVRADGARVVEMLDVLGKTYGKGDSEKTQKLKTLQPHAPSRRRCFYLAFLIGCTKPTLNYDISLLRKRASRVSGACGSSTRRLLIVVSVDDHRTVMRPLQMVRSGNGGDAKGMAFVCGLTAFAGSLQLISAALRCERGRGD